MADRDRQRQFLVSRVALRRLVGNYLGIEPRQVRFERTEFGKPRIIAPFPHSLEFSLSRSSGYILIAFAWGRPIGADIQAIRDGILSGLLSIFLSWQERVTLPSSRDLQSALFAAWSRKEALAKALGLGVSAPFEALELIQSDSTENLWHWKGNTRDWSVVDIAVPRGYVGAVAILGKPGPIAVHQFMSASS
jgi:4'-phosphopantetheinyl transferase